jgi:hypothetical protein
MLVQLGDKIRRLPVVHIFRCTGVHGMPIDAVFAAIPRCTLKFIIHFSVHIHARLTRRGAILRARVAVFIVVQTFHILRGNAPGTYAHVRLYGVVNGHDNEDKNTNAKEGPPVPYEKATYLLGSARRTLLLGTDGPNAPAERVGIFQLDTLFFVHG